MRNARSTANGVERTESHDTMATSTSASRKPTIGDSTMAINVLDRPLHTAAERPAFATPAPTRPPISACELEEGMPSARVIRFQTMAPTSAAKITAAVTTSGAMMPLPMVSATCVPNTRKAMKLKNAAHSTAYCGRSTRVETMVAIELAASCSPLRKSNSSATAIRPTRIGRLKEASTAGPALYLLDDDAVDLVGDVIEAIGDLFQMVVDFGADDVVHRVGGAMLEEQLLQADVVQVVDAAFQLAKLLGDRGQHRDVVADRLQERQRAADQVGGFHDQRPHFPHRRLEGPDLEQDHRFCGLLHLVDGVVHRGDQVLDVDAIERRDEGAAHRGQHLPGNAVGVVLELVDALAEHRRLVAAAEHALQRFRALHHDAGLTGKQVEKPSFPGQ